jgi:dTDP-D-glucose 4,6-dehydratase
MDAYGFNLLKAAVHSARTQCMIARDMLTFDQRMELMAELSDATRFVLGEIADQPPLTGDDLRRALQQMREAQAQAAEVAGRVR